MTGAAFVTADLAGHCEGAVLAQKTITEMTAGATTEVAWLRFIELATRHGWASPACRAFVVELAKRLAAASTRE
jgi:hypothetical protein